MEELAEIDVSSIKRFWCQIDGDKTSDDFSYFDELYANSGQDDIEFWKPIPEFKNLYVCSNIARIKNCKTNNICKTGKHENHVVVYFTIGKKTITRYLCNVVASAWVCNPNNYTKVVHKDENNDNNFPDNLTWTS
jgi:hypothetical protein